MDIVVDTSALIAVILAEPERERVVELAVGNTLIGPGSIPWEIGNAFSAMLRQRRITLDEARKGIAIFESIALRYTKPDYANALAIAHQGNMYAYDAYFLDCAMRHNAPILTLDKKLQRVAENIGIDILEV